MEKILKLYFHFPVHHAAVDACRRVAEPVQLQRRYRHVQRSACRPLRRQHADVVVQGPLSKPDGPRSSLRAVCLHFNRRYLPQHGRELRGGRNHSRYPQVEDHVPHHAPDGKARDFVDDSSRLRKRHGLLPGSPLPRPQHALDKIRLDELQVYRRSEHSCHHHDDLRRGDHAAQPAFFKEPQELHHRHRQVRPDLQDHARKIRQVHHRHHPRHPHVLHEHLPHHLVCV